MTRFVQANGPMAASQRLLPVAAGRRDHSAWNEAVIGLSGSAVASMPGMERPAVVRPGWPRVTPPTRGQMSVARRAEITLATQRRITICLTVPPRD